MILIPFAIFLIIVGFGMSIKYKNRKHLRFFFVLGLAVSTYDIAKYILGFSSINENLNSVISAVIVFSSMFFAIKKTKNYP